MAYIYKTLIDSTNYLIEPRLYTTATLETGTNYYTASIADFELIDGVLISIKIPSDANRTSLKIGSNEAIPIYYNGSNIETGLLLLNRIYSFIYANNVWNLVGDIDSPRAPMEHTHVLNEITDAIDLKVIEELTGTAGFLKKTGTNLWTLDNTNYTTNTGTVTSVLVQASEPLLSSTNSALNTSLNTTISFKNLLPNKVLAGPSTGSNSGAPTFRSLVLADLPTGTGATQVAVGNHVHGNITNDGKLSTANRMVYTNGSSEITVSSHTVDTNKLTVNISSDDTTDKKRFKVLGNNRFLSIGGSGIQAYSTSNSVDTASKLYLLYNGGNLEIGQSSVASAITGNFYGTFNFRTAGGFVYVGIQATNTSSTNLNRPIWFSAAENSTKYIAGTPVYDNTFKYNPQTQTLYIGNGTLTGANYSGKAATAGVADSANAVTWEHISEKPSTATSWPTFEQVKNKPTTLERYGITDAKIDNGVITLGSNTITPITEIASLTGSTITANDLRTNLGLSNAMHFIGIVASNSTNTPSDGLNETPTISGLDSYTPAAGDVVIDKNSAYEYVYTSTNKWELLGSDSSYSLSTHTHALSIVEDTGNNNITLGYGKKYKLTAGGSTYIFTMPASDNTNTATAADDILHGSHSGTEIKYAPYTSQLSKLSFDTSTTAPTDTTRINLNGYLYTTNLAVIGDTTIGTASSGALGIKQTDGLGLGLSLYGGPKAKGSLEYGIMFAKTATFGTVGSVTSDWATYFTMNRNDARGWIFKSNGGAKDKNNNVASIAGNGDIYTIGTITIKDTTAGSLTVDGNNAITASAGSLETYGGIATRGASFFYKTVSIAGRAVDNPLIVRGISGCASSGLRSSTLGEDLALYLNYNGGPIYLGVTETTANSLNLVNIAYGSNSSSISTGALIVAGGVGISKKLYVGESVMIGGPDAAADTGYSTANSGSKNYITFYGVYGDGPGSYNHTFIGESIYGGKTSTNERSELLLYHGNDVSTTSGPDRIRLFAAEIDILVYTSNMPTATSGNNIASWDTIRNKAGTLVANFASEKLTITGNILPEANGTRDLGKVGLTWNDIYVMNTGGLKQTQNDGSNYTCAITWLKNGTGWIKSTEDDVVTYYTRLPQIGLHTTGGTDSLGSICILPYATDTNPWGGTVGLYITKDLLKIDNKIIPNTNNTTGTLGSARKPVYVNEGIITEANNTVAHFGNAGKSNMNEIGKLYPSAGMTNLSSTGNADTPRNGTTYSSSWHLYWDTSYTDNPGGSNSWVALIVNKAGTSNWWVRSRNGGTITNGTAWASTWRHLVTSTEAAVGSSAKPVYINALGEATAISTLAIEHTAGGQKEVEITYGSTIDMAFMVGTSNENHGLYDYKAGTGKWILSAGASNEWTFVGNVTGNVTGNVSGTAGTLSADESTSNLARPIWFSYSDNGTSYINGKLGYNTNFMYNPSTGALLVGNTSTGSILVGSATASTAGTGERQIGVKNGSGRLYLYATAATNGNKGLYAYKTDQSSGGAILTVNLSNLISAIATLACSATITGTLTLSRTQDVVLTGTDATKPALIIGEAYTKQHLEFDGNEILSKSNTTTAAALYINNLGAAVEIGNASESYLKASYTTDASSTTTGALLVSGGAGIAKKLYVGTGIYITSTSADNHLSFSRTGGHSTPNYINVPASSSLAFSVGGYGGAQVVAMIDPEGIVPYITNTKSIGTSTYKWANVYATTFTGNLTGDVTGNADTATSLAATQINSETEITDGTKVYTGSGASWTGSLSGMAYGTLLHIGTDKHRSIEIWGIGKADRTASNSLLWRHKTGDGNSWQNPRTILDNVNTYAAKTDGSVISISRNTETKIATINGVDIKIKIPASDNTNNAVTQTAIDTDGEYSILLKKTANKTNETTNTNYVKTKSVTVNPSTAVVSAVKFYATGSTGAGSSTPGFMVETAAQAWAYIQLDNGSNYWDIATKSNNLNGALEFRPGGASTTGPYITTSGMISSKSFNIRDGATSKVTLEWNSTDQSLDFIFA